MRRECSCNPLSVHRQCVATNSRRAEARTALPRSGSSSEAPLRRLQAALALLQGCRIL